MGLLVNPRHQARCGSIANNALGLNSNIAGLVVNCGISNTIMLEIP